MYVSVFLLALLGLAHSFTQREFEEKYVSWTKQYNAEPTDHGLKCFIQNHHDIQKRNANPLDQATYALGPFADECPEDFAVRLGARLNHNRTINWAPTIPNARDFAAKSVDWRKKGAVTAVKNQGHCGSCWAFSAVGNMEGQHFLAGEKLVRLSDEEITECARNGNYGCMGGDPTNAFNWVVNDNNKGMDSETDYPYTSGGGWTGRCKRDKLSHVVAKFDGHVEVQHNEDQMAAWTAKNGPLSICVDARSGWQSYSGGIMSNCNGRSIDHCVLIVGYDTSASGTPYWIVKNSWGSAWGIEGYIHLQRGTNQCGLTSEPASINAPHHGPSPPPPPPPPPTPPSPPPPPPPPPPSNHCNANTTWTQLQCSSSSCTGNCDEYHFKVGQCIKAIGGGGIIGCCSGNVVIEKAYDSSDCTGSFTVTRRPVNKCVYSQSGGRYIQDGCG
eukprot:TRINITY_DN67468_c8_g10_i1.p1 TRINITY_DN67468_c8_g10~~TRINITY_DN67468_c8_g10_i1.p1  ORF type:complete len:443 (+),score=73.83 TRINITY_DN67468_c8_g10_i1:21-1349(+)